MIKFSQSRLRARAAYIAAFSIVIGGCASQPVAQKIVAVTPQATVIDVSPPPAGFYRVMEGDTLASIAAAHGRDASTIAAWNALSTTNAPLASGQLLRIDPPSTSTVAAGGPAQSTASCGSDSLAWPVKGPVLKSFGTDGSKAIVIGGKTGDTIRAAQSGKVVYTGDKIPGYGKLIVIKSGSRFLTAYGYNQNVLVKEGSNVTQGQAIATMGEQSGAQAALLFEVRLDRHPVDPLPHLSDCAS